MCVFQLLQKVKGPSQGIFENATDKSENEQKD